MFRNLNKLHLALAVGLAVLFLLAVIGYTADKESKETPTSTLSPTEQYLDEEFRDLGLVPNYDTAAWEMADAICSDLAMGDVPTIIERSITRSNYNISDAQAEGMVEISIETLCPKFSHFVN